MGAEAQLKANREVLAGKLKDRAKATETITSLRARVNDGDTTVTDEIVTEALASRSAIDAEIDELNRIGAELQAEIQRDQAMERLAAETVPGTGPARAPPAERTDSSPARVVREARTYTPETNRQGYGVSFFADAYQAENRRGDWRAASERIERHSREVTVEREHSERASTTTTFGSLIVPQYLLDMAAPLLRAGRPTANICRRHQLPSRGMSLIIPRITGGTTVQSQATQNTAVSPLTDPVVTDLTVPVVTLAGGVDVSRQALERGEGNDTLIYDDLARAHAVTVDTQVLNGAGTGGTMLGMLNTAGISAATAYGAAITAGNFNLKVAGQIAAVSSQGAGLYPKVIVMHPRRWAWLTGQLDSANRPVVMTNQLANFNAMAVIEKPGQISADSDPINGAQFVGFHSSGLPILTDLNVPTNAGTINEDLVIVGDNAEWHLWEEGSGLPRELKFEQTLGGSLTTKLLVYSYNAFTAGRYPGATGKIGGLDTTTNGQIAPTF